jgi:hypothetical protein
MQCVEEVENPNGAVMAKVTKPFCRRFFLLFRASAVSFPAFILLLVLLLELRLDKNTNLWRWRYLATRFVKGPESRRQGESAPTSRILGGA